MTDDQLERAVLELVGSADYLPMKPRGIARQLNLPEDRGRELKKLIKRLVKHGRLAYGSNHLVGLPTAADLDRLTGVFLRKEAGFGFVRPSGALPGVGARQQDIYITADDAGDASTGDTVLVRVKKSRAGWKGGPRGAIVEVIERESHTFVGTYYEQAGAAVVQVDGRLFSRAIAVGDPGAKNAVPNDKVVFEMVRFPSHVHDGEGVIVDVLGPRGAPGVDTLSIIHEYNLPGEFADDTLEAARAEADAFDESIPAGRLDLTEETVITIDPADARDFDDAISLVRLDNGHWRLGVHIADVSHFVRPRTALDREAHQRATSVYLPDRVIPMLPETISNSLASLQPGRVRYAKTAFLEFNAEGVRVGTEVHTAAIRSSRRLTYEEVDEYLADPDSWRKQLSAPVHELLGNMHELAMILRRRRQEQGALELTMREVKVDLDKHGRVTGAHRVENTESHQIIEEFMLSANEAVADLLHEKEWLFLRRVHHAPDPRKLQALTEFVSALGFQTESLESRFELQRLLRLVEDTPEEQAVNYSVLRSLQRAVYSPEQEGHYALASQCYCHFTSPIRRYPDLTIHRLIDVLLRDRSPPQDFGQLAVLGEHCSQLERRAEAAERELSKVKLLNYLSGRIGEELEAVVTGVEEFGLFVMGVELPAEGLVHISSLADDYYHFDRRSHSLTGNRQGNRYRLGDMVTVTVAHVDIDRRELDFRVVARTGHPKKMHKAGKQRSSKSSADRKPKSSGKKPSQPAGKKRKKKRRS